MMIFEDTEVIIPKCLLMLDSNQEIIVNSRMSHIVK
jgi:hypothetical protein